MFTISHKIPEADLLSRGIEEIIGRDELTRRIESGDRLRIKLGIDPTSPNVHLGRSIPLLKMRDFQELGHQLVFIVGDFTGVIGDTSDKESERPMLETAQVEENMRTYVEQVGKIIDMDACEVRYNSEWLGSLTYREISEQANCFSVSEFIARDNIRRRIEAGTRVSLREVLYPMMQGYDSVSVKADVELGGTDQRFNLLAGRTLQAHYGQRPQAVIMNPLVAGTDGRKMSSSWGNTVNLTDEPRDMFGKIMSVPDELIIPYFTYMTRVSLDTVGEYMQAIKHGENPRDVKVQLARELVRMYHSAESATDAEAYFVQTFAKKEIPDDIKDLLPSSYDITTVLLEARFATSMSDVRRTIEAGGVRVNGDKIDSHEYVCTPGAVVQKGKRFFIRVK